MKVLIVIDVQHGFMTEDNYKNLAKKIDKFLLDNKYDKIIFTKYINDIEQNPLYQTSIGWKGLMTKEEQDFCINVPKNTIIFEKYGYGLSRKDLDFIESLKVKEIDVCGLKANACVYAISLQLFDMGIKPNILINYVEGEIEYGGVMKDIYIQQFGSVDYKE